MKAPPTCQYQGLTFIPSAPHPDDLRAFCAQCNWLFEDPGFRKTWQVSGRAQVLLMGAGTPRSRRCFPKSLVVASSLVVEIWGQKVKRGRGQGEGENSFAP